MSISNIGPDFVLTTGELVAETGAFSGQLTTQDLQVLGTVTGISLDDLDDVSYPAPPTDNQVLTYDSLFGEWQPKDKTCLAGSAIITSTILLPTGYSGPLPFDSVEFDNAGYWNIGQPTRLTIPEDGFYNITVHGTVSSGATAIIGIRIDINGVFKTVIFVPKLTTENGVEMTKAFQLVAGDYVEMQLYQDGAPRNNVPGGTRNYMQIFKIC